MLLAAFLPLLVLLHQIGRWGVDAPYIDEWSLVDDLDKYARGGWTIDDVLRSHNGHRLLLLRLLLVPLAFLTGWNIRLEMFLEVVVAAATFALLALQLRRALGTGPTSAVALVLASLAVFSLSQWENWTWGFQVNVALAVFFSILGLMLLSREWSWRRLALALAAGALASFSQGAGLMVWPAGMVSILAAPRSRGQRLRGLGVWALAATAVCTAYAWPRPGDVGAPRPAGFALFPPAAYLAFVLTVIGGPVVGFTGSPWPPHDAGVAALVGLLGLIVLVAGWATVRERPDLRRHLAPLLAVAAWSVGVAVLIGIGRGDMGRPHAMSSRYMSLSTPLWVATIGFLAAISLHRPRLSIIARIALAALGGSLFLSSSEQRGAFETRWKTVFPTLAEVRQGGAPDKLLSMLHPEVAQVRDRIDVLRRLRLSIFREGYTLPPPAVGLSTFAQVLEVRSRVPTFTVAEMATLRVRVRNPTPERWSALGRGGWDHERAVRLSYHWLAADGEVVIFDGLRTALPRDLLQGDEVDLLAAVRAPEQTGRFVLRLSLVQEGVAWFDAKAGSPLDLAVEVAARR